MREKQYKIITKLGPNICHINNVIVLIILVEEIFLQAESQSKILFHDKYMEKPKIKARNKRVIKDLPHINK